MTGRVLVVGYGNPLRGDDGLGWHAVARLARDPRLSDADLLARHQLTPELAADIASARLVVLIDARVGGGPPGTITVCRVGPGQPEPSTWSHAVAPAALLALGAALYGPPPPTFLVTVTGVSFDHGDRLSPVLRNGLPEITAVVGGLSIAGGRHV